MGLLEDIGRAIGNACDAINKFFFAAFAEAYEKLFGAVEDTIIKKSKEEIAIASLDEKKFKTKEFQDKVKEIKKKWKESPGNLVAFTDDLGLFIEDKLGKLQIEKIANIKITDTEPISSAMFEEMDTIHDLAWFAYYLDVIGGAIPFVQLSALGSGLMNILNASGYTQVTGYGYGMILSSILSEPMQHEIFKKIRPMIIDPDSAMKLWYRKFIDDEKLKDVLAKNGFTDEDIAHLKESYLYYPSPPELVHWQAREVFEPAMVTRYGLDDEYGVIEKEPFHRAGMSDEQILNHWRAHWEHPEWRIVTEMLHRGQITEDEMKDWFRLVEIPPYWRQKMINISYAVPTRVDVRRWWDMRTISEDRLREVYEHQGYHGKDLNDYVLWTKVYVAFPDLIARFKKGWITLDDVRTQLKDLGMPEDRIEEMIETKVKPDKPERVAAERDLTKTDLKGAWKGGLITDDQAINLLMDIGYDEDEALFVIDVWRITGAGSIKSWSEAQLLANRFRATQGKKVKKIPEIIPNFEKDVKRMEREVEELKKKKKIKEKEEKERSLATVRLRLEEQIEKFYRKS